MKTGFLKAACLVVLCVGARYADVRARADDWPMWRFDSQRTSASPEQLPQTLQLLWDGGLTPRLPAWDDPLNLDLMTYDRLFEPIVLDQRLFMGFNDSDKLVAMDTRTGQVLWTFYTDGPVRLPPAGSDGLVYFCSDDGYLYCVQADTGALAWKFNGAPSRQHALGNRRLTSAWPARGGPVIRDGHVYFAASIWPFMGTFIYALDAKTGAVQWVNDSTGAQFIKQPHSAPSFAGVAPQGALVATQSMLIVPGGRSVPAVFERATGRLKYFELNAGGKGTGGSFVIADERYFYVHTRDKGTRAFQLEDGIKTAFMPNEPVLSGGFVYSAEVDQGQAVIRAYGSDDALQWQIAADGSGDLILAGTQLVAAGPSSICVIQLPPETLPAGSTPVEFAKIVNSIPVERPIKRLLVADQKLFAVTMDGHILAFGEPTSRIAAKTLSAPEPASQEVPERPVGGQSLPLLTDLLGSSETSSQDASGYAFWFGRADDPTLAGLTRESQFAQLIVVDDHVGRVDNLRRELDRAGRYGRVTVHSARADEFKAPQYVAHHIFVGRDLAEGVTPELIAELYQSVRPYGGELHVLCGSNTPAIGSRIKALALEQAEVEIGEQVVTVRRVGALPGSADWTHQYGDVANSIKSDDSRVKLPLGVLWFGGSSNADVLPRHGHGPPEQVVGGRLFIQGMNSLSARDVYTGRVLWKRDFQNLGTFDVYYDSTYEDVPLDPKYNQVHIPGANGRGTNYVVTEDRVYLIEGVVCHALDPATGTTLFDIRLPNESGSEAPGEWGYIGIYRDVLIGGLGFAQYAQRQALSFETDAKLSGSKAGFGSKSLDRAASLGLVGFDRHTGQQLWMVPAIHSFWHNGIVAGGGKVYCLDRNPQQIEAALMRRGQSKPDTYRILAFDCLTGQTAWEISEGIFGTWLGYSEEHDLLLQAGAKASDRLYDETSAGMAVYAGSDGQLQWRQDDLDYAGPCILHNDLIITNANSYTDSAGAFYLKTGKQKLVKNPLTGQLQPWRVMRAYGCNNIVASENLLTFRSGAAGFYDLLTDAGTGNLGGFKSGCTSNLIVANGVLNAPDYTRTCSCAYQNQTSLALVHMPEIDVWSVHGLLTKAAQAGSIQQLAINFGAPGDRRDESGTLWLEYPTLADPAPPLTINLNPEARYFQYHSSAMSGIDQAWILASGVEAISDLRISLELQHEEVSVEKKKSANDCDEPEPSDDGALPTETRQDEPVFDVKLYFATPPMMPGGVRVLDVYLGDKCILENVRLDPSGTRDAMHVTHLIEGLTLGEELHLKFVAKQGETVLSGLSITERGLKSDSDN